MGKFYRSGTVRRLATLERFRYDRGSNTLSQSISDKQVSFQSKTLVVCSASPRGAQLNVVGAFAVRTEVAGAAGTDRASARLENRYLRAGEVQRSAQRPGIGPRTDRALAKANPNQGTERQAVSRQGLPVDYRATAG